MSRAGATFAAVVLGAGLAIAAPPAPRLSLFVGVDVSGSFQASPYYADAMDFLARYLHAHLNGLGDLERPGALFVAPIGGAVANEPQTFYPIEMFRDKAVPDLADRLRTLFPATRGSGFTDYNAFLRRVAAMVKARRLALKPIAVVMVSDGRLDLPGSPAPHDYRTIDFGPLERLSRNVTVRLLYTTPVVAAEWETKVRRHRVRLWTQDAAVMTSWKDPAVLAAAPDDRQEKLYAWIRSNVDFGVRVKPRE